MHNSVGDLDGRRAGQKSWDVRLKTTQAFIIPVLNALHYRAGSLVQWHVCRFECICDSAPLRTPDGQQRPTSLGLPSARQLRTAVKPLASFHAASSTTSSLARIKCTCMRLDCANLHQLHPRRFSAHLHTSCLSTHPSAPLSQPSNSC